MTAPELYDGASVLVSGYYCCCYCIYTRESLSRSGGRLCCLWRRGVWGWGVEHPLCTDPPPPQSSGKEGRRDSVFSAGI